MTSLQSPSTTCSLLLRQWKKDLRLTSLEKTELSGELKELDQQIDRLAGRHIRVTVFGRVGVGKSSLLNALVGTNFFPTDIAHGCTRQRKGVIWKQSVNNLQAIELVDTPGIDEISANL